LIVFKNIQIVFIIYLKVNENSIQMIEEMKETTKIRELLTKHGVQTRQQMKAVAQIVGLEYVSIQQKFSGKRAWTREQLTLIAKHYNEPISFFIDEHQGLKWNAILKINDIPQRCLVQQGEELSAPEFENLVAFRDDLDGWLVVPGNKIKAGTVCYKILKIDPLPQPRVAALDDNADIPDSIAAMFAWQGIEVYQFTTVDAMLEAAKLNPFDGYILDWMLGKNETVEDAVVFIRKALESNVPITILTGELRARDVNQSDIARMVQLYNVSVFEKPAILEIIAKSFYKILFRPLSREDKF
jgi:CheY-like chemotaxis protein